MKLRLLISALILGGLLVVGGGIYFWKNFASGSGAQHGGGAPASTVQVVSARKANWRPTANLVGTVIALKSIMLSNETAGLVKEVAFESDSIVDAEQTLLTLDSSTEKADLAAAEATVGVMNANIRVANANIRLWEANVKRLSSAVEAKAAAATELDNATAQLDGAKAQLDRANSELEQANARIAQVQTAIRKKTIKAPFKARAGLRSTHPGQFLAEGASIVMLQGITDETYLDFAIPQDQLFRVKRGDSVMATSAVLGSEAVKVEVVAVDAAADYTTRNIRIRAKVPNTNQLLRPGMFVDITVPVGDERSFVVVPNSAIRRASFGDHVFKVIAGTEANQFVAKQTFVKLGPTIGADVIVLEGLNEGDEIAAAGSFKLQDGWGVIKGKPEIVKQENGKPVEGKPAEKEPTETKPAVKPEGAAAK